jgi:hypothetical protein
MIADQPPPDKNTAVTERMGLRIAALLLLVAALSVFVLWTVNAVGSGSEATYALYLAVDLVAVAMISYVQRAIAREGRMARVPLMAGCIFIVLLVVAGLYIQSA